MDPVLAARAQMALSLGFHMVFAALGIGMPLLMLVAEALWLRRREPHHHDLAQTWAKATALTFAIGAVSGTALSFELGLLWPRLMAAHGATLGPAFALEGYAFFLEAIFLGLYLYGRDRLSGRAHWWTGLAVAVSGVTSGLLVVAANAWMQTPVAGDGDGIGAALAVFRAPAWATMALHSTLSCVIATGFAVAAVHATGLLRGHEPARHRSGLLIGMAVGGGAALLQPISGDFSARMVAAQQPIKLAAMEALFETRTRAPLLIGGVPDQAAERVYWGLEIPAGLSLLAFHDPDAEVRGLRAVPRDQWPNVFVTHLAFQVMVGIGLVLVALSLAFWGWWWRRRRQAAAAPPRPLLWAVVAAGPLGFVALECGWIVTEVGRQPWAVRDRMRVAEAVTPRDDVTATLIGFAVLYAVLGAALVLLLLGLARQRREGAAHG